MHYARIMKRTTIMLPDELDAQLRLEARRRGVSLADLAREAIGSYLTDREHSPLSFIGLGEGELDDAGRVEQEVGKLVAERHDRAPGS
jgi:predicted transcriptional regulator